jgi:hypothetical protein
MIHFLQSGRLTRLLTSNLNGNLTGKPKLSLLLLLCLSCLVAQTLQANASQPHPQPQSSRNPQSTQPSVLDNVDDVYLPSQKDLQNLARGILTTIETNYGPLKLKKTTIGVDWQVAKGQFLNQVTKLKTEKQLVALLAKLLFSFNDAHVSIQLPSTLVWTLPLQISYAPESGSYILNYIETASAQANLLQGELPPIGAVLVSINGKTPDEVRKSIPALNAAANDLTNQSLFGSKIFSMAEASGIPLSQWENKGWDFEFEWKDENNNLIRKTAKLKYSVSGSEVVGLGTLLTAGTNTSGAQLEQALKKSLDKKAFIATIPAEMKAVAALIGSLGELFKTQVQTELPSMETAPNSVTKPIGTKYSIGQTQPLFKLPKDFKSIELPPDLAAQFNPSQVFAGTFTRNGQRVGLLRIPTYSIAEVWAAPKVIDFLIRRLEASTDYLILDQMNNPGGAVVYSDFWIQALVGATNPQKHLQFRVKPTSGFLSKFRDLVSSLNSIAYFLPENERLPLMAEVREQFEIVQRAFISHENLSQPVSLLPMAKLIQGYLYLMAKFNDTTSKQGDLFAQMPEYSLTKPGVYTKPIYMVINQFDFSGGDATPASLQDYGRVKLIGTRTAGAGGTVESFSSRQGFLQFTYSLTTSLMYRPGNQTTPYVENYGVIPDIALPATAEDYVSGFSTYLDRMLSLIAQDLKKN